MEYPQGSSASKRSTEIYDRLIYLSKSITKAQTDAVQARYVRHREKHQRVTEEIEEPVKRQKAIIDQCTKRLTDSTGDSDNLFNAFNRRHLSRGVKVEVDRFYDGSFHMTVDSRNAHLSFDAIIQRLEELKHPLSELEQQLAHHQLAIDQARELLSDEKQKMEALEKEKKDQLKEECEKNTNEFEEEKAAIYGGALHESESLVKEWNNGAGYVCNKCHGIERMRGDIRSFWVQYHYDSTEYGGSYNCTTY